ncbi:O-antigen ligase family protein [Sphingomonas colocasiae]|uniref:O-antigen ligase family protein n=1 Tax=Sphingomonas colocasiae TaxID=1848973 RepID=A0ABS7PQK3_9SPHN|nr:O-antigen ligase family protein [Sphingomonas colocasiae]MBY8823612.1 O-antigen ligase family protein [Sphingomonas colocasiae]
MMRILRLSIVPLYLALCLLLGGSVRGIWGNALLQLLALPLICVALAVRSETAAPLAARRLLAICCAAIGLVAVQLVPLPPAIWTNIPGRGDIAEGFAMLGQPLPWLPISLAPHGTLGSILWMLPAFAIMLAALRLRSVRASWMAAAMLAVTVAAIAVGALQKSSGYPRTSPWYFYEITNFGSATGFFANVNHMASLLLMAMPFLAALLAAVRSRHGSNTKRAQGLTALLAGAGVLVAIGIFTNGSLAGFGLGIPVLAASVFIALRLRPRVWHAGVLAILGIAATALVFSSPFNNLTGDEAGQVDSRYGSFRTGLIATAEHLPFGSGLGSFVEIYRTHENPSQVTQTYMNHVHNDYIELALELGVPGLALILLFLLWWTGQTIAIWRSPDPLHFARAATVASGEILAHSIVDYPLRTAAISALFGLCVALMALGSVPERKSSRAARHLSAG